MEAGMLLLFGLPRRTPPPDEAISYLQHLEAEYHAIPPENVGPKRDLIEKLLEAAKKQEAPIDWSQLFEIELLILDVLPAEKLLRKAWKIRERYQEAAGAEDFAEYNASKPPAVTLKDEKDLRADLEVLLQDLFWRHRLKTVWEMARKSLMKKFSAGLGAMAAVGLVATWALYWIFESPDQWKAMLTLVLVILAGAAGAFVSLLRRLDAVPAAQKRTVSLIQMEAGSTSLVIQSLLTGSIFALLILLMSGSGLLTGDLFPGAGTGSVLVWLAGTFTEATFFAKLILWAFVAGFAERLVPDLLDTLSKRQNPSEAVEPAPARKAPADLATTATVTAS
jgi:hypothetical protein